MVLWLLLQGITFAVGFQCQACAETRDRKRFLDEVGLRGKTSTARVGHLAVRIAAVYIFACLWLLTNLQAVNFFPPISCGS